MKSVDTLQRLIRILNTFYTECVSRELRWDRPGPPSIHVSPELSANRRFPAQVRHQLCSLPVGAQRAVRPALPARLLSAVSPALRPLQALLPQMQSRPASWLQAGRFWDSQVSGEPEKERAMMSL